MIWSSSAYITFTIKKLKITCNFCTSSVKQRRMQHRQKGCHCCSQKNQQICSDWGICIPAQSAHRNQETRRSWPKDGILGDSRKTYKAAIAKAFALPEFHIWFIYYGIGSSQKKLSWSAGLCVVSLKLFEFFFGCASRLWCCGKRCVLVDGSPDEI